MWQLGGVETARSEVATAAGATGKQIYQVAQKMVEEQAVRIDRAREILAETLNS